MTSQFSQRDTSAPRIALRSASPRATRTRMAGVLLGVAMLLVPAGAMASFSAAKVYRDASPGVVVIFGFDAKGAGSSGSGSVVTGSGLILTNNHVIFDQDTKRPYVNIQVFFKPDRVTGNDKVDLKKAYPAKVVARDSELDLALLKLVRPPSELAVISFGDSEEVEIGESVAAIGHPDGGGLWTLTTGTISSRRNEGRRAIFQTDAAINPGNSGGPLLDSTSRLVGVNTFVRRVNAQGLPLEGLNYSLRGSLVLDWLAAQGVPLHATKRMAAAPPPNEPAHEPVDESPTPAEEVEEVEEPTSPVTESDPTPAAEPELEDADDEGPRVFEGPDGEEFFGYPNEKRRFELDATLKDVYKAARKNARDAFDELESM